MNDVATHTMADRVTELARQIEEAFSDVEIDLMVFPSGSVMLDIRRHSRLYVLAYSPQRGFGVDEVRGEEGFLVGYAFASPDFDPAAEQLWALVSKSSPRQ